MPKTLRVELGITGPAELEASARDGVIELAVPDVPAHVEAEGKSPRIVNDAPVRTLTVEDVRAAIDRVRR